MTNDCTAEEISQALFTTDPLNTCCKENECLDEYDHVAEAAVEKIACGASLEHALQQAISEWFYDGESFDTGILQPAMEQLEKAR